MAYPLKASKQDALKAWTRMSESERAECLSHSPLHVAVWAAWPREERRYIPHPATFLNRRQWRDELPLTKNGNGKVSSALKGSLLRAGSSAEHRAQVLELEQRSVAARAS